MPTVRERLTTFPPARAAYRLRVGLHERAAMRRRPREALRWLARGREMGNFTYELENVDEMAAVTARVGGASEDEVRRLFAELESDDELRAGLRERLRTRPREREPEPFYGGRFMWYALARLRRPVAIAELGIHDGLGTAVLARAVERNAAEGFPGHVLTFDLSDRAGWLVGPEQAGLVTHHAGDVNETLPRALAERPVEMSIHDTNQGYDGETFELETVLRYAPGPVTAISRDARHSGALRALCERRGLTYELFQEQPRDHWWPGGEHGLAVIPPG
ncbi:MAG TPA: class I SAM-dependent methyltransferase [Solirubrobacteraceae bacterium]|nr:class I SAM-dependent methyltransferase [Solirubrobacteraceae bacterium]